MLSAVCLFGLAATVTLSPPIKYPEAKRSNTVDNYFGTSVPDPYRWLEDAGSPETVEWVQAENKLTFAYLDSLPDRAWFKDRLKSLFNFERYSAPDWQGQQYIYRKNDGLQNQSVVYALKSLTDQPTVLLDPNKLSDDGTVAVSSIAMSENGALLAYGLATSGSDWNEIRIRNVATHADLSDRIQWVKFSEPSWTKDSRGFFYSRFPEPTESKKQTFAILRNQKLYYHRLGDREDQDQIICERPNNPDFSFTGTVSHDGRFLFVTVNKGTDERNLLYYKDLCDPAAPRLDAPLTPVVEKSEAEFQPIGSIGQRFFVRTDLNASKYRVIEINLADPVPDHWKEVIPESGDLLARAEIISGKLVVNYLVDAKNQLAVFDLNGKKEHEIPLPAIGSITAFAGDPDRSELFYAFTSFLYPPAIYRYDFTLGKSEVFKRPAVDLDPSEYETKQIFYSSRDGTRIPMFIVHRKGLNLDRSHPVYLTGYGGFNISQTPNFSPSYLSWIEKGGVFALPNLRGGGEYGRAWHEAGMKELKQNVFDDFISAADVLIQEKYSSPGEIAIVGGSNGGLLIGAALTQRPDLFGAAVPRVGVLDMLRFQKFTIGWAWRSDYGSAETPEEFSYLIKYSPLHNIQQGRCYCPVLIVTADRDDRVVPGHSFKFAAALQAAQGCGNSILIRVDTKAGHGGGKPLSKVIDEEADVLAFMWDNSSAKAASTQNNPVLDQH